MYAPMNLKRPAIVSTEYSTVPQGQSNAHGVPLRHSRLNLSDGINLLASAVCCVLGLASIYVSSFAIQLGQTNQLVVIGFLLSLMAYFFQGRAQKTLAAMEVVWGQSRLQNFESIVQLEILGQHRSASTRLSILFLLGLPLALSVAYKQFTGGTTSTPGSLSQHIEFGPTPPPNTQNVGWGLSLFSSSMQPWWSSPGYPAFRGYSQATFSPQKAALLDSPLSSEVSRLQSAVRSDQSKLITATVAAIEARMIGAWENGSMANGNLSTLQDLMQIGDECRDDSGSTVPCTIDSLFTTYFTCQINNQTINNHKVSFDNTTEWTVGTAVGQCDGDANSYGANRLVVISRAALTYDNDLQVNTFPVAGQAFEITVQPYRGTWNITHDTAVLLYASSLAPRPLADAKFSFDRAQRIGIEGAYYDFIDLYQWMISEFDWKYSTVPSNITTDTTFVATMVWSRLATKIGPTSPSYGVVLRNGTNETVTWKYTVPVHVEIYTQTLKRHWGLAVVLITFPVLTLLAILIRGTLLGSAPISDGFGIISLLAAAKPTSPDVLRGAGYSGKLRAPIRAIFSLVKYRDERRLIIDFTDSGVERDDTVSANGFKIY